MPSHFIKPYLMPDTCAGYFLFAGRDRGVPCHILAGTRYHTTRKSAKLAGMYPYSSGNTSLYSATAAVVLACPFCDPGRTEETARFSQHSPRHRREGLSPDQDQWPASPRDKLPASDISDACVREQLSAAHALPADRLLRQHERTSSARRQTAESGPR